MPSLQSKGLLHVATISLLRWKARGLIHALPVRHGKVLSCWVQLWTLSPSLLTVEVFLPDDLELLGMGREENTAPL